MDNQLFDTKDRLFKIESHGVTIACNRLNLEGYVAFHIEFSSDRRPMIIARAEGMDRPYFWTAVPEGRQEEAEGVGKLIEEYLSNRK